MFFKVKNVNILLCFAIRRKLCTLSENFFKNEKLLLENTNNIEFRLTYFCRLRSFKRMINLFKFYLNVLRKVLSYFIVCFPHIKTCKNK